MVEFSEEDLRMLTAIEIEKIHPDLFRSEKFPSCFFGSTQASKENLLIGTATDEATAVEKHALSLL